MTLPPYDDSATEWEAYPPGAMPSTQVEPPAPAPERRSRRGVLVAGAVAGVLVLGSAGYAVAAYFSGSGTQPEDVLPADALGFVKLDLDPSFDQKMELMSLLGKFPDVQTEGEDDVRGSLLQPLLDESGVGLDFATDVQPWLGDRLAVAVVPDASSQEGLVPVLALAVDDSTEMADALTEAQANTDFGFALRDDYVLVTDTQERADQIAEADRTLSDNPDFAGDRAALTGDQVVLAWADLSAVQHLVASEAPTQVELFGAATTGRMIVGVHAQDDALEMVGLEFSVSDVPAPESEPTQLMHGLPADTTAALAISGLGERAATAFQGVEDSGALEGMPGGDLGFSAEDLRALLGTDLVVAAFGDLNSPAFGARVMTEQPEVATQLVDGLLAAPELGISVVSSPVDGGYAVGSDQATLDAMTADGGLGDTDAFQAAVADPASASAIGFVELHAVVESVVAQGGPDGEAAKAYSAVEALGFSATSTDEGGRFVLRITTR